MSKLAEYYFDYKIEKIFGDRSIKTPRLYFERDCERQSYFLYAVPAEWLDKQDNVLAQLKTCKEKQDVAGQQRELNRLAYDTVNVIFDIKGVECSRLADPTSEEYKNAEIKSTTTFDDFYETGNGCRIFIENQNSQDRSGIGVIDMVKKGETVARFFFAINFTFRKKIAYKLRLEKTQDGHYVHMEFECKDRPCGIPISLVQGERLPCLKNDMGSGEIGRFHLNFSEGPIYRCRVKVPNDTVGVDTVFSLTIPDETIAKYYILDSQKNETLKISADKNTYPPVAYTCPYCHKPIEYKVASSQDYKKNGGISCRGEYISKKGASMPVVIGSQGGKHKRCMYCASDLNDNARFFPENLRLLPSDFMEHNNFKIAITGSTRAGKTTYISRFFGVSGDDSRVNMSAGMLGSSLNQFGITSRPVLIPKLKVEGDSYKLDIENWASTHRFYTARGISLDPLHYPQPTEHGDYTPYPFMLEVNKNSYVSFYDMAGEDAQTSTYVNKIANNGLIGVFCIINGQKDTAANNEVIAMLDGANLHKDTPIAVIVTKMDILEQQFDSNCRCLKTDYYDGTTTYEGSTLEYEINYSSEEIKSFLKHEGLLPNFTNYKNVKYFGVSSFNFLDSIHWDKEDINTPGKLKFECSSKRMELPFIWILKQFGLIN